MNVIEKIAMMVLLMALAIGAFAQVLNAPTMQCVMPIDGGRIRITWSCEQNDCEHFKEYHIFVNNSLRKVITSAHTLIDTSLCQHTNFEDIIPSSNSYECYLIAYDSNDVPYYSDTIRSINLQVTPSSDRTKAVLTWQPPTSSFDNSWDTTFDIYKKRGFETSFPTQPFASVPISNGNNNHDYTDLSDVCYDSLSYQVSISHIYASGTCSFMSAIMTVTDMIDAESPEPPVLDSVSVTPNNQIILGFHESERYMMAFIIDKYDPNTTLWTAIDTVEGQTYWIDPDPNLNPRTQSRTYRVAAMDSCGNVSRWPNPRNYLCNIKVILQSTDPCLKSASIEWDTYNNLSNDVNSYEVILSDDLGRTWATIATTTNNSYKIDQLDFNKEYRVYVRAVDNEQHTASSSWIPIIIQKPASADFSYIQSVSVINNQYIRIKAFTHDTPPFDSITLQRSEDNINFENFKKQNYIPGKENYIFEDSLADFKRKTYYYRTFLSDNCLQATGYSNISHNILLHGMNNALEQTNLLTWKGYEYWDGDVSDYTVMCKKEDDVGFSPIYNVVPSIENSYLDDISPLYSSGAKFTYYIEAIENTNQYGFSDTSHSNIVTLTQPPTLYIPNAFRPSGGINNEFKPANSFVTFDQYCFSIFTRTGERIFITTNPQEGWNGRKNNNCNFPICPENVYVYHIEYKMPDGTVLERTGTVTLLK